MILRNDEPFPARGSSVIREGDVLFVVSDERDLHAVRKWMTPGTIA
ncbi:MAG: hypothetical protein K8E66_04355 [Phycisphaerales bacterium]|nr:hypothetical protein [Phycisphaerales bacterium]